MKHKLIFFSVACNAVLALILGFLCYTEQVQISLLSKLPFSKVVPVGEKLSVKKHTVAIIMPATHKALESIARGFEETLINKYKLDVACSVFNANGNRMLLRAQIEEIATGSYDIAVPIGAMATQLTKEVFTKKGVSMPIVCAAVADPESFGLIEGPNDEHRVLTGSTAVTNYTEQIEFLFKIKPVIKKVLLLYDPAQPSGQERYIKQIKSEFAQRQVKLEVLEVFSTREVQQKIPLVIDKTIDVVMILKDNTVVSTIDMLVTQCERHECTLFAGDLDSVSKGAALGYGVCEYSFGTDTADCAYKILHDGLLPKQVPMKATNAFHLGINRAALKKQGIVFDEKFDRLLRSVLFVGD